MIIVEFVSVAAAFSVAVAYGVDWLMRIFGVI